MKINVTGRHIHITEALQLYIENKFKKIEKHFANVIDIHVILTVEKIRMEAEATLKINKGNIKFVEESIIKLRINMLVIIN